MNTDPTSPFGHWDNTDERLQELHNRLAAWFVAGEQLPEVFQTALHKFTSALEDAGNPLEAPAETILEAFEAALTDFDNILATFPEEGPEDDEV